MTGRVIYFGGDVRCIGEWRFEDGGFVSVMVGGKVPTQTAIEWVERLLEIKKDELAKLAKQSNCSGPGFKAAPSSKEGDPSVMPDCPGPDASNR